MVYRVYVVGVHHIVSASTSMQWINATIKLLDANSGKPSKPY